MTIFARTRALTLIATAVLACMSSSYAESAWPTRPVTIIVAQAAGSSADTSARIIATALGKVWGQTVVIENRVGADGLIGVSFVARAPADGYTIGYAAPSNMTINQFIYKKMPFRPLQDLDPVTQMTNVPFALVVNPKLPVHNVHELVAYAKEKKGELNFSSAGVGNVGHLAAELLSLHAGFKMHHIPNKGDSPALMDVASGNTDLMFVPMPGANASIKAGRVRLIAIGGTSRLAAYPDIPTIEESGFPGVTVSGWGGIIAPVGTPPAVVNKIQADIQHALALPQVASYLASTGSQAVGSNPAVFKIFLKDESKKWSQVIKQIGLSASE
jgi:tripartite-type tricarboxylate transporter receptor subunit TctC